MSLLDSANFGKSLHCLLRKMNVSFHPKAVKIHRLFPCFVPQRALADSSLLSGCRSGWMSQRLPSLLIITLACVPHDKLHPIKYTIMKRISEYAADIFYSRYGGGPRLTGDSRCLLCFKKGVLR